MSTNSAMIVSPSFRYSSVLSVAETLSSLRRRARSTRARIVSLLGPKISVELKGASPVSEPKDKGPEMPIRVAFVVSGSEVLWEQALNARNLIYDATRKYRPVALHLLRLEDDVHTSILSTEQQTRASGLVIEKDNHAMPPSRPRTHIVSALHEVLGGHVLPTLVVAVGSRCLEKLQSVVEVAETFREKKIPVISIHDGDNEVGRWAFQMLSRQSGGTFHALEEGSDLASLMAAASVHATGRHVALEALARDSERPQLAFAAGYMLAHLPRPTGM